MAGEMHFPDLGGGDRIKPGGRVISKVVGANGDVVDVDKKPAAGAAGKL